MAQGKRQWHPTPVLLPGKSHGRSSLVGCLEKTLMLGGIEGRRRRGRQRMRWLDGLTDLMDMSLRHHSSKASILQHLAFFMVQLSNSYMTTGKTIALTIWIFVSKVMSLLFNTLSRFVIVILPRSKHLQSPSTLILELKKIKSVIVSIFSPSICHEVMGPDA